jgi:hypothetical protein
MVARQLVSLFIWGGADTFSRFRQGAPTLLPTDASIDNPINWGRSFMLIMSFTPPLDSILSWSFRSAANYEYTNIKEKKPSLREIDCPDEPTFNLDVYT